MNLSFSQTVIATVAIVGVIVLGALHDVGGESVIGFLGVVVGGSLGYVNGKKVATKDAAAVAATIVAQASTVTPIQSERGPL